MASLLNNRNLWENCCSWCNDTIIQFVPVIEESGKVTAPSLHSPYHHFTVSMTVTYLIKFRCFLLAHWSVLGRILILYFSPKVNSSSELYVVDAFRKVSLSQYILPQKNVFFLKIFLSVYIFSCLTLSSYGTFPYFCLLHVVPNSDAINLNHHMEGF